MLNCDVLMLPGWGAKASVFDSLSEQLSGQARCRFISLPVNFSEQSVAQWCDDLAAKIQQPLLLVGWSLGGMLAARFAERYPQKVSHLLLLACNPVYVARDDWPSAMAKNTFEAFEKSYHDDAHTLLKRFAGLCAHGGQGLRTVARQLRQHMLDVSLDENSQQTLAAGLSALQEWDNRLLLSRLTVPVTQVFAANDALVPVAVVEQQQCLYPQHKIICLAEKSHALPLDAVDELAVIINDCLGEAALAAIDHDAVAKSFGDAAESYDSVAHLQRRVADKLVQRVASISVSCALDIGCGTGYSAQALAAACDVKSIIVSDIALPMLLKARGQRQGACDIGIACDAEQLALKDASVDLLLSSLALQWTNLQRSIDECARVLSDDGVLCFASLGPLTLQELRQAWQQADGYAHVNRFLSKSYVKQCLQVSGFSNIQIESEMITLHFADYRSMAAELKALGAHNVNASRPAGLSGRASLKAMMAALEEGRQPQGLPLSYEVYYVHATRG